VYAGFRVPDISVKKSVEKANKDVICDLVVRCVTREVDSAVERSTDSPATTVT